MEGASSDTSMRETLKPLPPQSTRKSWARSTASNWMAGTTSSRSTAGLSVTV